MPQHDMVIANADGATVRADINSAFEALSTAQSGAAAPSPTFAFQLWADTANNLLKQRNAANTAWIERAKLDTAGASSLDGQTADDLGGTAISNVESLDHTAFPKTLDSDDKQKMFVIDLSGATADCVLTLPAEATAGAGWGSRIRLTGLASGFKLIINNDGATAEWEMSVPGQLVHPVTDGTDWFNAQPGGILADTWITSSTTHNYAAGAVVADVVITGGGGGGAGGTNSANESGSAGGSGETRIARISGFGSSETVTIGGGGSPGGSGGDGSSGAASSWGSFATANAGGGGITSGTTNPTGGSGGSGGSGGQGFDGNSGQPGVEGSGTPGASGASSFWGGAGEGGEASSSGSASTLGAGGSGGGEGATGGGSGGDGIAHVVEYA